MKSVLKMLAVAGLALGLAFGAAPATAPGHHSVAPSHATSPAAGNAGAC